MCSPRADSLQRVEPSLFKSAGRCIRLKFTNCTNEHELIDCKCVGEGCNPVIPIPDRVVAGTECRLIVYTECSRHHHPPLVASAHVASPLDAGTFSSYFLAVLWFAGGSGNVLTSAPVAIPSSLVSSSSVEWVRDSNGFGAITSNCDTCTSSNGVANILIIGCGDTGLALIDGT